MNNKDINPNYKGRFLEAIVSDYGLKYLKLDEGTVLLHDSHGIRVFFQVKCDFTYPATWVGVEHLWEMLPGSVIDDSGGIVGYTMFATNHVRVPTDEEFFWYERQNVV